MADILLAVVESGLTMLVRLQRLLLQVVVGCLEELEGGGRVQPLGLVDCAELAMAELADDVELERFLHFLQILGSYCASWMCCVLSRLIQMREQSDGNSAGRKWLLFVTLKSRPSNHSAGGHGLFALINKFMAPRDNSACSVKPRINPNREKTSHCGSTDATMKLPTEATLSA